MRRRALLLGNQPKERIAYLETQVASAIIFRFSTKKGAWKAIWNDGSESPGTYAGTSQDFTAMSSSDTANMMSHEYAVEKEHTIDLEFKNGINDVFSIRLGRGTVTSTTHLRYKILDFGEFINQFPELYSIYIHMAIGSRNSAYWAIINGFLNDIPDSVNKVRINTLQIKQGAEQLSINFSEFSETSQLWYLTKTYEGENTYYGDLNVWGDLSKMPKNMSKFILDNLIINKGLSYTPGRIWNEELDTFILKPNVALSSNIVDDMLNDMSDSIITAIGNKIITLKGTRTSASDTTVVFLENLGFTVTVSI